MNDQLVRAFKFHYWQENVVGGVAAPNLYLVDHGTKRSQKSRFNIFQNLKELPLSYGLLAHGAAPHSLLIHRSLGVLEHQPWASPAARKCPGGIRLRIWSILEDVKQHTSTTQGLTKKHGKFDWNSHDIRRSKQVYSLNKLLILILGNHLWESSLLRSILRGVVVDACRGNSSFKLPSWTQHTSLASTRLKITETWFCL